MRRSIRRFLFPPFPRFREGTLLWRGAPMLGVLCFAAMPKVSTAQSVAATYLFSNSLAAEEASKPSLVSVDPLTQNVFETANVLGTVRPVFHWSGQASPPTQQAGLSLNTKGLLASNNYSVEMVFEFLEPAQAGGGWRRILDTQNRQSDNGFYVEPGNSLQVYNDVTGTTEFTTGVFHDVVLTNFVTNGVQEVKAYLDGNLELTSNTDQLTLNNPNNPDQLLHFFLDNTDGPAQEEFADGRIGLLRLYNGVLSAQDVKSIDSNPFGGTAVPEPSAWMLFLALAMMTAPLLARRASLCAMPIGKRTLFEKLEKERRL